MKIENSGVWVIRKQNRRKRQGMQDEVTPISTYYVVGINVCMAPTVANVVGSRTVCLSRLVLCAMDTVADERSSSQQSHPSPNSSQQHLPSQASPQPPVTPIFLQHQKPPPLTQAFNSRTPAKKAPQCPHHPPPSPQPKTHPQPPKHTHPLNQNQTSTTKVSKCSAIHTISRSATATNTWMETPSSANPDLSALRNPTILP